MLIADLLPWLVPGILALTALCGLLFVLDYLRYALNCWLSREQSQPEPKGSRREDLYRQRLKGILLEPSTHASGRREDGEKSAAPRV
jgi:hypothetical protein